MKVENLMKGVSPRALCLILLVFASAHGATKSYNATTAANYAKNYYNTAYNSTSTGNPFTNYVYLNGGNCTNFVSQALMAGLSGATKPRDVYAQRMNFIADRYALYLSWYFISDSSRGPAWTGANKLYEYAKSNRSTYKGLHFNYVTNDSPTKFMDYNSVRIGDIIFADWESNGSIDHAMIVTGFSDGLLSLQRGYNRIRVTYQSGDLNPLGKTNMGLGDINDMYKKKVSFYVYRPVNYSDSGL